MSEQAISHAPPRRRIRIWHLILLAVITAIAALILLWDWDWFIPFAQSRGSAALGRPVTIKHLHVHLARHPVVTLDGLAIANPDGFPEGSNFATADHVAVTLDAPAYLHHRVIVIPTVALDHPVVEATALPDNRNSWSFPKLTQKPTGAPAASGPDVQIGDLRIADGHVHALVPKFKADFNVDVSTAEAADGKPAQLIADAKGTYADQPINGHFVGGALLSLRDAAQPYPVDLQLANGKTTVALRGTVQDPLSFKGTDLKLKLEGPDMGLLTPLTGVPIPQTPPFSAAGDLTYADQKIHFEKFEGKVGNSDLEGSIAVDPGPDRPLVSADLASRRVDLTDLGGFIGTTPGRAGTPGQTAEQKKEHAQDRASSKLLPDTPLNLPKLRAADVELKYRGAKIQGRGMPFDSLNVDATIRDGHVDLHPATFTVAKGQIIGNIKLDPLSNTGDAKTEAGVHTRTDIEFRQVDVTRLMQATGTFGGAGTLGGRAVIEGSGKSLADILGTGNGEIKLFMTGGNLSALLVDLSGLEFGNAVLSALGVPQRAQVRCLVTDFVLQKGELNTRTMLVDTTEANIHGLGRANLRDETLDLKLRTEAKHFSVGSLKTDITIGGKLKSPSILPDAKELGSRAGAAVVLGVALTPLAALLPTIQLGLGDDNNCAALIATAKQPPSVTAGVSKPGAAKAKPAHQPARRKVAKRR